MPENADGKMTKEDIIVTYYYKKIAGGVIINHIDIHTGKQLVNEEKLEGYVGDQYETEAKTIANYKLVEDKLPTNAKGEMIEGIINVTYYYESPGKVIVNYYDKDTNKKLTEEVRIDGFTGEKYKTEEKSFEYYKLVEIKGEKEGQIEGEKHVDYMYQKMKFNLKVDKEIERIETGGTSQTVSGKLGKTEIYRKELNSTNVRVTYKIKVTNDGELAGTAALQENIPQGMNWSVNNDKTWKV